VNGGKAEHGKVRFIDALFGAVSARSSQWRLTRAAFAALISFSCAWACPVRASDVAPQELHWDAAVGCPDADAGRKAIDDLLAPRGLTGPWGAAVIVTIIRRPDARWQAEVAIRDAGGATQRHLDGAKCSTVAGAAALVVAMALETIAASERTANAPAVSTAAVPPLAAPAAEPSAFSVALGARAVFDAGSLPLPSAGVGPLLSFQFGALRLAADVTFWLPRLASGPNAGSGAQIGLLSAAMHGSYLALPIAEQFGIEPCVTVEAGIARGFGVEVLDVAHQTAPWAALFAGVALRQRSRSGLSSGLMLQAGAPLFRPNYVVTDYGRVFRAWPIVARAAIDVAWTFP
jgi:hypothetical protein